MSPSGAALSVEGLTVRYGDLVALRDVEVRIEPGAVVALVGPNGAGKSSFARTIAGLVPVASGRIRLDDHDVTKWSADRIRRGGLAYVPEGRGIFPNLSVSDNLRMAVRQAGGRVARAEAVERAETMFPILSDRRNQRAGLLSGGEQQMLGLARALALSPRLVVVDEMSLGLAPMVVERVFESLDAIRGSGITIVIIEQFVHRVLEMADECIILSRGTVGWRGAAADAGSEVLDRYLGHSATAR